MTDAPSIFVFGSNLAGRHGKGAARDAVRYHDARYGQGIGRQGNSYAIPTKDENLRTLPLDVIQKHVSDFLAHANMYSRRRPGVVFQLTAIGCGLAGYKPKDIAPMFRNAPTNVLMPPEFVAVLELQRRRHLNGEFTADVEGRGPNGISR